MIDKIILGAGIYGLYAALFCGKKGESIVVFEKDSEAFMRATYINQARVHNGYHYPRSISTALKSAHYFERFNRDFDFAVNREFKQVYATSSSMSWTNSKQFMAFCDNAKIRCDSISPKIYFKNGMCDGAFETEEYTYDAKMIKEYLLKEIESLSNVTIQYNANITRIEQEDDTYVVTEKGKKYRTGFLLNCTYASVNQIHNLVGVDAFDIKYELCEIILCSVNERLKNVGITVMDGPFFSIMPFGKTGYHSLTSVTFTPHLTSYEKLPCFPCQKESDGYCSPESFGNCNNCLSKPQTAFPYMSNLAKKYLRDDLKFEYKMSLYSIKPILKLSEVDDSRPTVIKVMNKKPVLISVLSGKINTVYDLDDYLDGKIV